jgi:hypothetical protein
MNQPGRAKPAVRDHCTRVLPPSPCVHVDCVCVAGRCSTEMTFHFHQIGIYTPTCRNSTPAATASPSGIYLDLTLFLDSVTSATNSSASRQASGMRTILPISSAEPSIVPLS